MGLEEQRNLELEGAACSGIEGGGFEEASLGDVDLEGRLTLLSARAGNDLALGKSQRGFEGDSQGSLEAAGSLGAQGNREAEELSRDLVGRSGDLGLDREVSSWRQRAWGAEGKDGQAPALKGGDHLGGGLIGPDLEHGRGLGGIQGDLAASARLIPWREQAGISLYRVGSSRKIGEEDHTLSVGLGLFLDGSTQEYATVGDTGIPRSIVGSTSV